MQHSNEIEYVTDRTSLASSSSLSLESTLPEAAGRSLVPPSHSGACHTNGLDPTTRDHRSRSNPFPKFDCRRTCDPVSE